MGIWWGIALVVTWVAVATYGDAQFKMADGEFLSVTAARGFAAYLTSGFVAVWSFSVSSWGWVFIAWNCLSLVVGITMSVMMFHEPMTWRRAVASGLLLIAMCLAE